MKRFTILDNHYKREAWENLNNLKIAQLKIFHALNNLITGKFKNIKIRSLHSPHVHKRKLYRTYETSRKKTMFKFRC